MKNVKLIRTGSDTMVRKDGQKFSVIKVSVDTSTGVCKECRLRPRAQASSRCEKCSQAYKKRNGKES